MSDAELIALAAMVNLEAVQMHGENITRQANGYSAAWAPGCGYLEAGGKLYDELYKRGIMK